MGKVVESEMPSNEKVIDLQTAIDLTKSEDTAFEIWSLFSTELVTVRKDITLAYQQSDWQSLSKTVHKLYSSTLYTSTPRLKRATKELEIYLCESANIASKHYNHVIKEIDDFLIAYEALRKKLIPGEGENK